jgi:N6-adenosine-specific RNA methylase IME4
MLASNARQTVPTRQRRKASDRRKACEHSRKPDCVRERIERLIKGPHLELFARETKSGWDCWGNQAGPFDAGVVPTRRQPSRLIDAPPLQLVLP